MEFGPKKIREIDLFYLTSFLAWTFLIFLAHCVFLCSQFRNILIKNLLYSKVFHVRSVTQGDVIRAEAKDIPRIFQVIFFRKCTINNLKKKLSKSSF